MTYTIIKKAKSNLTRGLLWSLILMIAACSFERNNKKEITKYPVTSPIIVDTVFNSEYVADIHSLQNVEIRARVKGYIETIHVDEGKFVKAGQKLFSINNQHYQQELIKARALLKSALAEEKAEELAVKNAKSLSDKNVVSVTELEMAEAKLEAANAKVEEAKSDEAAAALSLSLTEIRAPFDGVINRIPNKVGSLIDEGTLLTVISNNKEVFAYFNVSEREYLELTAKNTSHKKGEVSLVLANNKLYPYKGIIETVEGEFDKTTGNIAFRARFSNPENVLKHGSSGKILLKRNLQNAIIIPQKSTVEIQENTYVYVLDEDNIVHMKSIVPKLRIQNLYVIESDLGTKDKIVYEGIQFVKDGDKIIPEVVASQKAFTNLTK